MLKVCKETRPKSNLGINGYPFLVSFFGLEGLVREPKPPKRGSEGLRLVSGKPSEFPAGHLHRHPLQRGLSRLSSVGPIGFRV